MDDVSPHWQQFPNAVSDLRPLPKIGLGNKRGLFDGPEGLEALTERFAARRAVGGREYAIDRNFEFSKRIEEFGSEQQQIEVVGN